jgi:plastocyanin
MAQLPWAIKHSPPNHIKVKVGSTIVWTNDDSTIHTVTSGAPNTPDAGQVFDSGLTSLISPSKSYSHKFTSAGEFSYFCRFHPTMVKLYMNLVYFHNLK